MATSLVTNAFFTASYIYRPSCQGKLPAATPSSSVTAHFSSLHSRFIPQRTALASSTSSYLRGHSLPSTTFGSRILLVKRSKILKIWAGKPSMGCTKRSKSRLSRARTSGFRVRMQTPTGRNVLKRRRAKGRKQLVPATNPNSGKYA